MIDTRPGGRFLLRRWEWLWSTTRNWGANFFASAVQLKIRDRGTTISDRPRIGLTTVFSRRASPAPGSSCPGPCRRPGIRQNRASRRNSKTSRAPVSGTAASCPMKPSGGSMRFESGRIARSESRAAANFSIDVKIPLLAPAARRAVPTAIDRIGSDPCPHSLASSGQARRTA